MGTFVRGQVVVLPFPFSDLSETKPRPALVLANLNTYDDVILCMISAKGRDPFSIEISSADFAEGRLRNLSSYVRLDRLFTAESKIISRGVGRLKRSKMDQIRGQLVRLFEDDSEI